MKASNKCKAYTSMGQSKVLEEILPIESADHHYSTWTILDDGEIIISPNQGSTIKDLQEEYGSQIIPCWSVAALMNLLPSEFTERGEYSRTTYRIDIRKHALTRDEDIYQIAYGNYHWHEDGSCSWLDKISSDEKRELIDAVYQMICLLKEKKIIKYEY